MQKHRCSAQSDLTPSSRCLSKRSKDYNQESVSPKEMLAELGSDNQAPPRYFSSVHETCEKYNDSRDHQFDRSLD
jgi:hypothetical protein